MTAIMADHAGSSSGEEADVEDARGEEDRGEDGKKKNMAGMMDVISKILNKNLKENVKGVVLSKYKEGKKRKLERDEDAKAKKAKAKVKSEFREKNHVVPDRSNAEKEILLRRIGTKGVVKLFNAVSKHQKEMESKLKGANTEVKKVKVMDSLSKSAFLDMLKTDSTTKKPTNETSIKNKIKDTNDEMADPGTEAPSWNILRDDFMMGSKMKDWDKKNEDSNDDDDELNNSEASFESSEDSE